MNYKCLYLDSEAEKQYEYLISGKVGDEYYSFQSAYVECKVNTSNKEVIYFLKSNLRKTQTMLTCNILKLYRTLTLQHVVELYPEHFLVNYQRLISNALLQTKIAADVQNWDVHENKHVFNIFLIFSPIFCRTFRQENRFTFYHATLSY